MRVPCDAYELLWIGADGSLQLCDVALPLGNVNAHRLRDLSLHGGAPACRARRVSAQMPQLHLQGADPHPEGRGLHESLWPRDGRGDDLALSHTIKINHGAEAAMRRLTDGRETRPARRPAPCRA
jgi:hypothetical protein